MVKVVNSSASRKTKQLPRVTAFDRGILFYGRPEVFVRTVNFRHPQSFSFWYVCTDPIYSLFRNICYFLKKYFLEKTFQEKCLESTEKLWWKKVWKRKFWEKMIKFRRIFFYIQYKRSLEKKFCKKNIQWNFAAQKYENTFAKCFVKTFPQK